MNHLAFQLKKCQPPPVVPRAEMLTEDEDYEIGEGPPVAGPSASPAPLRPPPPPPAAVTQVSERVAVRDTPELRPGARRGVTCRLSGLSPAGP